MRDDFLKKIELITIEKYEEELENCKTVAIYPQFPTSFAVVEFGEYKDNEFKNQPYSPYQGDKRFVANKRFKVIYKDLIEYLNKKSKQQNQQ